jgi:hypothetical protein
MWLLLFAPYTRFLSVMLQKLSGGNNLKDEIENLDKRMKARGIKVKTLEMELKNMKNKAEIKRKSRQLKLEERCKELVK